MFIKITLKDMKKRIFFMAMLIAVLSFNTLGQNAKKYYKAGTEFVDNLKYEDAIVQFSNAIELDPSDPEFYNTRGQTYEKLLKYPEAKSDFEKALVFSPKDLDILVSLGAIANKTGNYKEALKILNQVSGIDKRNPDVYP
jgi:tetratricopeptide (TPR) repeat protein